MKRILVIATACFLVSCATSTPRGSAEQALTRPISERIHWPDRYDPRQSTFFVHNEIEIQASPRVIWNILVDAESWPLWYEGAKEVKIKDASSRLLSADSDFTWKTMGMSWVSQVKEFVPYQRLATESRKSVIQGYHAWLIVPNGTGCKVITDESFRGPLGRLQGTFIPNKLHRLHQMFLEELKKKAEAKTQRSKS